MTTCIGAHTVSRRTALTGVAGGVLGVAFPRPAIHASAQDASPDPGPDGVSVEYGVVYGEIQGRPLLLDVYRPADRDVPRPAVLVFHGGGWTYGISGPSDMEVPARALATAGYVTFNVSYRRTGDPAGEYIWPDQLDDVQRSVRWVRANAAMYGVDPDRIGAYGHSAGAHLASMLGVRETRDDSDATLAGISSRVSWVVALAGQFDLTIPYSNDFARDAVVALLGGGLEDVPDAFGDASPVTWTGAESASFLIIHGGADDQIMPIQARTMVGALQSATVDVVYAALAHADHFTVAAWPISGPWSLTFFDLNLRPDE